MPARVETVRGPVTREQGLPPRPRILRVTSNQEDIVESTRCELPKQKEEGGMDYCKGTTQPALVNYEFTLQGIGFRVPNVWVSKCDTCEDGIFFAPEVDEQIDTKTEKIILAQERRKLAQLNPQE